MRKTIDPRQRASSKTLYSSLNNNIHRCCLEGTVNSREDGMGVETASRRFTATTVSDELVSRWLQAAAAAV